MIVCMKEKWQRKYSKRKFSALTIFEILVPALGIVIGLTQIRKIQQLFIQASHQPANIVVDSQGLMGELPRTWLNLAQGGENSQFSLKPMMAEMKIISPEYIRIDHLFDFYIKVTRSGSSYSYDFTKLDQLLAEMKSIGALPFISLSYTPEILNPDITGVPSNWQDYQAIIHRTIEHVSGFKEQNIAGVYYEVWNEPDLFGQWKTYGTKNYLDLYRSAARAASAVQNVQPFKLGGPATTKLYDNWVDALIKMVIDEHLKFDFYSWHHYNEDPDAYVNDVERLKQKLRTYPTIALQVEYIISEWGIDSNNNKAYDGMMSAAHLVASVINFPPNLSKAFSFEIQDGKSPGGNEYWGRWGLFTAPDFGSHAKPRAKVIELMNQLGNQELSVIGQGSNVKALAVHKGKTIQVLLANYDIEDRNTEMVPLTLKRMVPGNYTITQSYLGRNKLTQQVVISSDTFVTTVPLIANNVVLWELAQE